MNVAFYPWPFQDLYENKVCMKLKDMSVIKSNCKFYRKQIGVSLIVVLGERPNLPGFPSSPYIPFQSLSCR